MLLVVDSVVVVVVVVVVLVGVVVVAVVVVVDVVLAVVVIPVVLVTTGSVVVVVVVVVVIVSLVVEILFNMLDSALVSLRLSRMPWTTRPTIAAPGLTSSVSSTFTPPLASRFTILGTITCWGGTILASVLNAKNNKIRRTVSIFNWFFRSLSFSRFFHFNLFSFHFLS